MEVKDHREEPWARPKVVRWCQLLLDSYRTWVGRELLDRQGSLIEQAGALFHAPFVVVSHGTEDDPIFNFGNQTALLVWETTWEALTKSPSRLTAEPVAQAERARMLAEATEKGYIDHYRGIRMSMKGRRFLVEQAVVWNVMDAAGATQGQAATFSHWKCL